MRKAVGSTWIYSLVITFTLIFTAFLSLALTYAKAYKLKNEMTIMIEKYEGLTTKDTSGNSISGSINIINTYLKNNGYATKGSCFIEDNNLTDAKIYGMSSLTSNKLETASSNKKYYYCITVEKANDERCTYIFGVKLFYNFNLPLIGNIKKFSVSGKTNEVYDAYLNGSPIKCKKK